MAHEIGEFDSVVLNRTQAWHNLGKVIEQDMSPKEALEFSGLDWPVGFPETTVAHFGDVQQQVKARTLFRLPKNGVGPYVELGTMKSNYVPLQNEQFFEIAYALGAEVKVESAGSLFNGKKLFLTIRGETIEMKQDRMDTYLALLTSHDGTLALSALPTSTRIVCNNTLSLAMKTGASKMFKVMHCSTLDEQIKEMREALCRFKETGDLFRNNVELLAERRLVQKDLMEFWTRAYIAIEGDPKTESEKNDSVLALRSWDKIMKNEQELLGEEQNLWLAANAVTNWVQHRESSRGRVASPESIFWNNLQGVKQDKSTDVFNLALALR